MAQIARGHTGKTPRTGKVEKMPSMESSTAASSSASSMDSESTLPPLGNTSHSSHSGSYGHQGAAPGSASGSRSAHLPALDLPGAVGGSDAPPPGSVARFCTQCGSGLVPGGAFCAGCGLSLAAAAQLLLASARSVGGVANGTSGSSGIGSLMRGSMSARSRPHHLASADFPARRAPVQQTSPTSSSGVPDRLAPASARQVQPQLQPGAARRPASTVAPASGSSVGQPTAQALPRDPVLQDLSMRMSNALVAYFQKRGIHTGMTGNWDRFFKEVDTDGSGKMTLEELDSAVRGKLRAQVSRYELRALWQRVDSDGSGLVTSKEFVRLMYRLYLTTWPDLSPDEEDRITRILLTAAERWHHAGGNWIKIFKAIDAENSGHIAFDEFLKYVRAAAGLQLAPKDISDRDLQAYWKTLDANGDMDISVKQFMTFLRKRTTTMTIQGVTKMHKLTKYAQKVRGVESGETRDVAADIAAAPPLDDSKLCDVTKRLANALGSWLAKRGIGAGTFSVHSPKVWVQLFEFIDADRTGRLSLPEFELAIRTNLKSASVSDDEVRALWRLIDPDTSGEASKMEFSRGAYRIQMLDWPRLDAATLQRIVGVMNSSADKWHRCGGNWYKVFAAADTDGSGEMDYEELGRFLRNPFPCLSLSKQEMSEADVRGLWRALDADCSGQVTTREFTAFMRQHGRALSMHRMVNRDAGKKRRMDLEELGFVPERSEEELQNVGKSLERALMAYMAKRGIHGNTAVQNDWGKLFREADGDGSGRLTFLELESLLRDRLSSGAGEEELVPGVTRDDLLALWAVVDVDRSGEVTSAEWSLCLYRLELGSWPSDDVAAGRVVDEMNKAAAKWHQAGGNWYKVFRLIDSDNSGKMGFDELKEIVRRPLPCLAISAKKVPDQDLRAMWKALDEDRSGQTTVREFMVFMRRHGAKKGINLHQSPTQGRLRSRAESRSMAIRSLSGREAALLNVALETQTPEKFQKAYREWSLPWTGTISEWDLLSVVRGLLDLNEEKLDDDAVHAFWRCLDRDGAGEVAVETLFSIAAELGEQATSDEE
mmetsp:Transcript_86181/g.216887  ORF Transcript_86181/g.216887 Transcript_86181/m.216887 type:complete len:1053 (+) Transcript_86181:128-3286(+)